MAGWYDRQGFTAATVLVAAVAVGIIIGRPHSAAEPTVDRSVPHVESPSREFIVIHVSGEVVSAGLVEVSPDARVADAIAAAGGVKPGADLSGINLAASVVDGQQVVIPSDAGTRLNRNDTASGDTRVRVNQADMAALETLPGVGPVLAEAIVAHRAEYGPFETAEDLLDVPGIGEQKLASLRDRVIVP